MISLGEDLQCSPLEALKPSQPISSIDPADTVIRFKRSLALQLHHFELVLVAAYEREVCLLSNEIDTLRSQLEGTAMPDGARSSSSKSAAQDAIHMSHWQEAPLCNLGMNFEQEKPTLSFDLDSATEEASCELPNVRQTKIAFEVGNEGRHAGHSSSSVRPSTDDLLVGSHAMERTEGTHEELESELHEPFESVPRHELEEESKQDVESTLGQELEENSKHEVDDAPRAGGSSQSLDLSQSKTQRRKDRLRKLLQARIRSNWKLESESERGKAPRWSKISCGSEVSDETQGSGDYVHHKTSSFGRVIGGVHNLSKFRCFVILPQSRFRLLFDLLGIAVMAYDLLMTPLIFFDLPESTFTMVLGWVTRVFWTLDLWLNFHTAAYHKGILLTEFSKVAKKYLKTSFISDFTIVLAEWLSYVLEETDARSLKNLSLLRIIKGMRFLKVMRFFKLERILHQFRAQTNSTLLVLFARPLFMVFSLLFAIHVGACLWYGIGKASSGWIMHQEDSSFGYMYATSFHWSMSQLHGSMEVFPTNVEERMFMSAMTFLALILFSTFLSSITNSMMQIHALRAQRSELDTKLRVFLAKRHVSAGLTIAIKTRMDYISSTKHEKQDEAGVLEALPEDLVVDLNHEIRRPVVLVQSFFHTLDKRAPRIIRKLCHDSMSESFYLSEQKVFSFGDACIGMLFIQSGTLTYRIQPRRTTSRMKTGVENRSAGLDCDAASSHRPKRTLERSSSQSFLGCNTEGQDVPVERGSWLAEASLWMIWECCGDLDSVSPSWLLVVDADGFAKVIEQFHWVHVNACRYSVSFIERMVKQDVLTDHLPDDEISTPPFIARSPLEALLPRAATTSWKLGTMAV